MRIIDAHQHFWDLGRNYHPWLSDRPLPFRYGDYSAIKRDYLPERYLQDTAGFDIAGTVYVEAEWDERDPTGEVDWIAEQRAEHGLPSVMVAQAWLHQDDAEAVLASHGARGFVRGIRHKPAIGDAPSSMRDPAWRRGYAQLAPNGLSFDLQTPWDNLRGAAELAEAHPETTIVINHTGLPSDRSEGGLKGWAEALRMMAQAPNVAIKISGLGQPGEAWTADANRRVVLETIEIFGASRCMFASNFPVDSLVAGFDTIFGGFLEITAGLSEAERQALFCDNAMRIYRIEPQELRGEGGA